jgi:hypothetical protein
MACLKDVINRFDNGGLVPEASFKADRADTTPAVKTNEPTPMSINDVPQFSTFAKRRGKTGKSTASIAMHVMTIMAPL